MPVTVNTDLPLHEDRSREWDGDGARSAMARRCSTDDGVMANCMGPGFIWRDPDADASTIGAYALPVADVFDGQVHLVLSGVQAAANSISPERDPGGPRALQASESELGQMRTAVETILARFAREYDDDGIRAPWEADEPAAESASAAPAPGGCVACGCDSTKPTEDNDIAADERPEPKQEEEAVMPSSASNQTIQAARTRSRVIRASATGGEWRPPTGHFANPHLTEPTKLTVTSDGRVFGHLATWDQPHIGYDGKLVYPPKNADGSYGYFRQSQVVTSDASVVPVGIITMNTGHADEMLSADAAAAHYDNTGTMVAACNVGEDAVGIWLAGSMLPDVSPELRNRFSLARVSGDWRQPRPGSQLELIAALSVPNPGFPVRQSEELLASDRLTLAASGRVVAAEGEIRTFICSGATVLDEAQQAALTDAVRAALGDDFVGQVKNAVIEAINAGKAADAAEPVAQATAQSKAAIPTTGGEESTPATEGEPDAEGTADVAPAPEPAPAAEDSPVPGAEAAEAVPAPAPEPDSAPSTAPAEAAQVAASALAVQVRRMHAARARQRLMAAAGLGKKA
jgi:hypothetical protein